MSKKWYVASAIMMIIGFLLGAGDSISQQKLRGGRDVPAAPWLPEAGRDDYLSAKEWEGAVLSYKAKAIIPKGDPGQGRVIYFVNCVTCHGPDGKGDGPTSKFLDPKPRNHTDGAYMNGRSDETLFKAIKGGGLAIQKSVVMPMWSDKLTEEEMWNLVSYLRTIARPPYKPKG